MLSLASFIIMRRHVTANEVYEFIKEAYPTIGKGTVYRNLDILVEEGALRKVEVPDGPNRFDFTLKNHYHVRCIKCGEIFDVDMDQIPDLLERIHNTHGNPGQEPVADFCLCDGEQVEEVYAYCNLHGLWKC